MWFNQPYLINTFKKGDFRLSGRKNFRQGKINIFIKSRLRKIAREFPEIDFELNHTGRLIPVYPETEGLSSKWLRFIVKPLLIKLKDQIPDSLPQKISKKYDFLPFQKRFGKSIFPIL